MNVYFAFGILEFNHIMLELRPSKFSALNPLPQTSTEENLHLSKRQIQTFEAQKCFRKLEIRLESMSTR